MSLDPYGEWATPDPVRSAALSLEKIASEIERTYGLLRNWQTKYREDPGYAEATVRYADMLSKLRGQLTDWIHSHSKGDHAVDTKTILQSRFSMQRLTQHLSMDTPKYVQDASPIKDEPTARAVHEYVFGKERAA